MFAPAIPTDVVLPRRTINPLFPICFIGVLLLLIAAVIVLALIPIYLKTRYVQPYNTKSTQFTLTLVLRNGFLPLGSMSAQNCDAIQNALRQQALANNQLKPSLPTVSSCTVVGNSATTRKRKKRDTGNLISNVVILSSRNCETDQCSIEQANVFRNLLLESQSLSLTLSKPDGSSFTSPVSIISASSAVLVPSETTLSSSSLSSLTSSVTTTSSTASSSSSSPLISSVTTTSSTASTTPSSSLASSVTTTPSTASTASSSSSSSLTLSVTTTASATSSLVTKASPTASTASSSLTPSVTTTLSPRSTTPSSVTTFSSATSTTSSVTTTSSARSTPSSVTTSSSATSSVTTTSAARSTTTTTITSSVTTTPSARSTPSSVTTSSSATSSVTTTPSARSTPSSVTTSSSATSSVTTISAATSTTTIKSSVSTTPSARSTPSSVTTSSSATSSVTTTSSARSTPSSVTTTSSARSTTSSVITTSSARSTTSSVITTSSARSTTSSVITTSSVRSTTSSSSSLSISSATTTSFTASTCSSSSSSDLFFYAITADGKLLKYDANNPGTVLSKINMIGVVEGEIIMNIDFQTSAGDLVGASSGRLYYIDVNTGVTYYFGTMDTTFYGNITCCEYDSSYGSMFFGTDIDESMLYSSQLVQTYGNVTLLSEVDAIAFDNNIAGSSNSSLYILNGTSDALFKATVQGYDIFNANSVSDVPQAQIRSGLGINITRSCGFDILPNGTAVACVQINNTRSLYFVDLKNGTLSRKLGDISEPIISLAAPVYPIAYAIVASNNSLAYISTVQCSSPVVFMKNMTGLQPNETIVALDIRPANHYLYALGRANNLYYIDFTVPQVILRGSGNFTPALNGRSFDMDFNPVSGLLHVISNTGQQLILNSSNGAVIQSSSHVNPSNVSIAGIAYSNNIFNASNTTLYAIDNVSDRLLKQENPQLNGTFIDVGPLGIDVKEVDGFDIGSITGTAYAIFLVNGTSSRYTINLSTGQATLVPYGTYPWAARSFAVGVSS